MDEAKLAELLGQLTPDEIDAAAEELHGYARHRRVAATAPSGAAMAPFNFKVFLGKFVKVVEAVQAAWPIVAPLVGLDPANPATAPASGQ